MDIRPLDAGGADAFITLFDAALADNPHWSGCYCAYYDDPCPDSDWVADASAAGDHRAAKRAQIESGAAHGLLAWLDGEPVGWCNAGPRHGFVNLRTYARAVTDPDEPVGCVMCFVVHREHRGRGVATALLDSVDDYFRSLELSVAEGYPRREPPSDPAFPWPAAFYKGTIEMYERAGYEQQRGIDGFVVMRKSLR